MCHFLKAKGIGYFRNIPLGLAEQYLGLLVNPAANNFTSSSPGGFF